MGQSESGTINLIGDVMLTRRLGEIRKQQDSGLDAAIAELGRADLALANLEMSISDRGYRVPKGVNLRAAPEVIDDIASLRVAAVTLATNHMMDYGPDAMLDTVAACDRAGIPHCGAGADLEAALAPVRLRLPGATVAVLNVSCTLPVESEAGLGKPGIAPLHVMTSYEVRPTALAEQPGAVPFVHSWARPDDQAMICERVAALKTQADIVVIGMHWGVAAPSLPPNQGPLAEYQQPLGRALVDAGADIVWGHHSHAPDPIEIYRGKPIFYGLGHFILENPWSFMRPESVIAEVAVADPFQITLVPLMIDDRGLPRVARGDEARQVLSLIEAKSRPFGTVLNVDSERGHILCRP